MTLTEANNLIAHYTAEIEDLEFELGHSNRIIQEQQAEIERLREENSFLSKECNQTTQVCIELQKQAAHSEDEIRKVAKWISASTKPGVYAGMKCSLCGARIKYSEFYNGNHNFCHKCGAKMEVSNK